MEYSITRIDNNTLRVVLPAEHSKKILEAIQDLSFNIVEQEWQSIVNAYVCYNEEPFQLVGFNTITKIVCPNNRLEYTQYILEKHIEKINHLEACLLMEV